MSVGSLRRSLALALALVVAGVTPALADTVVADGDAVQAGTQGVVDLGTVGPGATLHADVWFTLVCSGLRHVDPGQTVTVSPNGGTVPVEGGSISATDAQIGPVPSSWADDSGGIVGCPSALTLTSSGPSHVTIVAPPVAGSGYQFTLLFARALSPAGVADGSSLGGSTAITFTLTVADADTTPPVLHDVPTGVEGVTENPAGMVLAYTPPTATDDRDPAPVVACVPAPGALAPIGPSSVLCTATDSAGNSTSASFPVLVHLASVRWSSPVGDDATAVGESGRSLPVRAWATLDGAPVTAGSGRLVVSGCGPTGALAAGFEAEAAMAPDAGGARWSGLLRTDRLGPGCHSVTLEVGGLAFGSFRLDLVDGPITTPARSHR